VACILVQSDLISEVFNRLDPSLAVGLQARMSRWAFPSASLPMTLRNSGRRCRWNDMRTSPVETSLGAGVP